MLGPGVMLTTVAATLKLARVSSRSLAFSWCLSVEAFVTLKSCPGFVSREMGGNLYGRWGMCSSGLCLNTAGLRMVGLFEMGGVSSVSWVSRSSSSISCSRSFFMGVVFLGHWNHDFFAMGSFRDFISSSASINNNRPRHCSVFRMDALKKMSRQRNRDAIRRMCVPNGPTK